MRPRPSGQASSDSDPRVREAADRAFGSEKHSERFGRGPHASEQLTSWSSEQEGGSDEPQVRDAATRHGRIVS